MHSLASPLGRGFLAGVPPSDEVRAVMPRFQEEVNTSLGQNPLNRINSPFQAAKTNQLLVDKLKAIAAKKDITAAQLCIAWVGALGEHVIPLPGSS